MHCMQQLCCLSDTELFPAAQICGADDGEQELCRMEEWALLYELLAVTAE